MESSSVIKISPEEPVKVASGLLVGTLIAGFAHADRFCGKAVVGGVCLTARLARPPAAWCADNPWSVPNWTFLNWQPSGR